MSDGFWLGAGNWAWNNWDKIKDRLEPVFRRFRKSEAPADPQRGILIIGPGGAGKSTMAHLLSGQHNWLTDEPWSYEQSFFFEESKLVDDPEISMLVMPGQSLERSLLWDGIGKRIVAGDFRGIILVASYGHENFGRLGYKSHPLFTGKKDEFLERYTARQREEELRVLSQLLPYIRSSTRKLWLLTVVSKEDLWYPDQQVVQSHYSDGPYGVAIRGLIAEKGSQLLRAEALMASLVIGNWTTAENELLVKNAAGYDHRLCIASIRRIYECLHGLIEWEDLK